MSSQCGHADLRALAESSRSKGYSAGRFHVEHAGLGRACRPSGARWTSGPSLEHLAQGGTRRVGSTWNARDLGRACLRGSDVRDAGAGAGRGPPRRRRPKVGVVMPSLMGPRRGRFSPWNARGLSRAWSTRIGRAGRRRRRWSWDTSRWRTEGRTACCQASRDAARTGSTCPPLMPRIPRRTCPRATSGAARRSWTTSRWQPEGAESRAVRGGPVPPGRVRRRLRVPLP